MKFVLIRTIAILNTSGTPYSTVPFYSTICPLRVALISTTITTGLILILTLHILLDILTLLDLATPSHSIAEVLAHGILVLIRLCKGLLTIGTVLLDPLGAREVNTWRVQNILLDAIVSSDWFGSRY